VSTIPIGGMQVPVVDVVRRGPGSKSECMNGGWQNFRNPSFTQIAKERTLFSATYEIFRFVSIGGFGARVTTRSGISA
jgi:hypothetical protein